MRYEFIPYLVLYTGILAVFAAWWGQAALVAVRAPGLLSRSRFVFACFWIVRLVLSFFAFVSRMIPSRPFLPHEVLEYLGTLCLVGLVPSAFSFFWNYFRIPLPKGSRYLFSGCGLLFPLSLWIDLTVLRDGSRLASSVLSVLMIALQSAPCVLTLKNGDVGRGAKITAAEFLAFFLLYAGFTASNILLGGRHFIDYDFLFAFLWASAGIALLLRDGRTGETGNRSAESDSGAVAARFGWTSREREVVDGVLRGWSNKQIAHALVVTEGTVKAHLYNLYRKAEINSRLELINLLYRAGAGRTTPKS